MAGPSQALIHNWRLKVSALGLSVFLWALVQTEPINQETFASVPVRVEITDTMWTTSDSPTPSTVELRLGGPAREIIRLARDGTSIRIPVTSVGSRDTTIELRREWVELGQRAGVTVQSVSPASVRISFEEARTRLIPVSMRIEGRVRDPLALATPIEVNPRLVRVRGPASRLDGLDSIPLMPFDLNRLTRSGMFTVAVDTSGLAGASVVPSTATLGVRVEDMIERVLDGLVVQANASPGEPEVVADPAAIDLTLAGARTLVTALDPSRLRIWVPSELFQGMAPGEERQFRVQIEGVPDLVTAVPGTDMVTVRRVMEPAGTEGRRDSP